MGEIQPRAGKHQPGGQPASGCLLSAEKYAEPQG